MTKQNLTWLHLSDIHFGHGKNARHRVDQEIICNAILRDTELMAKQLGSPEIVMVTGDIAFSANSETEYPQAIDWLEDLLLKIDAKNEQLYLVPGNHDVDRGKAQGNPACQDIHKKLRQEPAALDDYLTNPKSLEMIWPKLSAYADNEFIKSCAAPQLTTEQPYWVCEKDTALGQIVLVGLNTVLLSYDSNDGPSNLALGWKQLQETIDDQNHDTLLIVLQHHPPECLTDGQKLQRMLQNRPHMLFCGHIHQQGGLFSSPFSGGNLLRFVAGAGHVESNAPREHAYAWGRLSAKGMEYFPRTWNENQNKFVPDKNNFANARDDGAVAFNVGRLPNALSQWLLRSKTTITSNDELPSILPPKPALFVGHEEDLQEIVHFLRSSGCIYIYGEPGVGKTTLASMAVWSLCNHFHKRVLYHKYSSDWDFNDVLNFIARFFSENTIISLPFDQKQQQVKRLLGKHQPVLLYLDGVDGPSWIDELQEIAGCCSLIITSRHNAPFNWLHPKQVGMLDCESSITLFEKLYQQPLLEQDKDYVKKIVNFLGYLPLAIELCAHCARASNLLLSSLPGILQSQMRDMLASGPRSTAATIELSYKDLADQPKQFFRMLSVFDGRNFSMEAVEAIWDNDYALRHLLRLIELSLVKPDIPSRFALHPVIQAFVQHELKESGEADIYYDRMIHYFLNYTEKNKSSFTLLECERENIFDMMQECDNRSYYKRYLRFAEALLKLQPGHYAYGFLSQKGFWQEALEIVQRSLELTTDHSDTAKFYEHLGLFHYWLGKHDEAMNAYDDAWRLYEQHNDFVGKCIILQRQGFIISDEGKYEESERLYRESLNIAKQNELSVQQIATATHLVGVILYHQCRYNESRKYLEEALEMRDGISSVAMSVTQRRLAGTYRKLGEFTKAERLLKKCLLVEEEMGNERNIARCLRQLGLLCLAQDNSEEAHSWLEKSFNIFHKIGNKQGIASVLTNLGEVNVNQGELNQAQSQLNESLSMAEELSSRFGMAMNLRWLAQIYYHRKEYSTAIECAQKALTYFEQIDYVHLDELCALLNKSLLQQSLEQTNKYPSLDTYEGNAAKTIETEFKEIWENARPSFLINAPTIDKNLLDLNGDNRRGISLIARLSEGATKLLTRMQNQLKAVAPEQHYYNPCEYHITIMTLISANRPLQLSEQQQNRYVQNLSRILSVHRPFRVHFQGISATKDSIIVLGFFKDGTLDSIRRDIREKASAVGLEGKIDDRYFNMSAHVTFVRLLNQANLKELAEEIDRWQYCDFGVCPINELELVTNDWYMTTKKVEVLKTFKLLPSAS